MIQSAKIIGSFLAATGLLKAGVGIGVVFGASVLDLGPDFIMYLFSGNFSDFVTYLFSGNVSDGVITTIEVGDTSGEQVPEGQIKATTTIEVRDTTEEEKDTKEKETKEKETKE